MRWMILAAALLVPAAGRGAEMIHGVKWGPLTAIERQAAAAVSIHPLPLPFTPYNTCRPKVPYRCEILADRNEYLADDPVGQFLVYFVRTMPSAAARLKITVTGEDGRVAASRELAPVEAQKIAFLLEMAPLAPGRYRVNAEMLGVENETLLAHGAVSEATAAAMAAGALRHSLADWALAITGVAGPGGGSPDKPVGTVCFGWAGADGRLDTETCHFKGAREEVRAQSVARALNGLLERANHLLV